MVRNSHFRAAQLKSALGFTLIELMVTISVAAILLTVVVPSFKNFVINSRIVGQTNSMVAVVNFARSEAIKRNTTLSLCPASSNTATTCATTVTNWQYWIVRTAGGAVLRRGVINTYDNTLVVKSTLTNGEATLGSDGRVRTGGALTSGQQISVCSTSQSNSNIRQIVLGSGSRISVQTTEGGC